MHFLMITAALFFAVLQYIFWKEFYANFNFIAVDYLIYTNEVIGNIMESYPIVPIFLVIALFAFILTYIAVQNKWKLKLPLADIRLKLSAAGIYVFFFILFAFPFDTFAFGCFICILPYPPLSYC